jgi:hypothetical protein
MMKSMSARVGVDGRSRTRRIGSVAATALLALFATVLALPLCSAMIACTMPCCEESSAPAHDHEAMPSSVCGGVGCTLAAARACVDPMAFAVANPILEVEAFEVLDGRRTAATAHVPLTHSRPTPRPLYVLNDVFLI